MYRFIAFILIGMMMLSGCCHNSVRKQLDVNSCRAQCSVQMNTCKMKCVNSCENCAAVATAHTARHYQQFVNQQYVQGGLIARELNSYRDPLQCRKTTCDCRADYKVCTEACTGIIHKRLQSPMKCC